jgi:hypothetical protein|tara:strand:+ start:334 stop:546 length:213 start_codon:yes stop_codon:yes gene_type:complete
MTVLKGAIGPTSNLRVKTLNLSTGRLLELTDVDPVDLGDGSVVVYNATSEKFEIRRKMENANTRIIGGTY